MTERGDRVPTVCPGCSPDHETVHEVISTGGGITVRCRNCQHVHTTTIDSQPATRQVRTIVSQDDESIRATIEVPTDALFEVGQEFIVESDEAIYSVRLMSIEDHDGNRHDQLPATETMTLWTRDIGNVSVPVTMHPPEGSNESTRSLRLRVPGDDTFTVGETMSVGGEEVRIHGIHPRDVAVEDDGGGTIDSSGVSVQAKDIDRLYVKSTRRVYRQPW